MCKISVQENRDTLKYVENPTEEMYKLVSLKNGCNLYDIKIIHFFSQFFIIYISFIRYFIFIYF